MRFCLGSFNRFRRPCAPTFSHTFQANNVQDGRLQMPAVCKFVSLKTLLECVGEKLQNNRKGCVTRPWAISPDPVMQLVPAIHKFGSILVQPWWRYDLYWPSSSILMNVSLITSALIVFAVLIKQPFPFLFCEISECKKKERISLTCQWCDIPQWVPLTLLKVLC